MRSREGKTLTTDGPFAEMREGGGSYRVEKDGTRVFERTLHGLRNTILLPARWELASSSQCGTIGTYQGRVFLALINLKAENAYEVTLRARKP